MSAAVTSNVIAVPTPGVSLIVGRAYCGVCEVTRTLVRHVDAIDIRCPICRSLVILDACGDDD